MRRTCSLGLFLVLGICLGLGFNRSWGQTSRKLMNLQGRLTDTEGSPTNGRHLFELRVFDSGPAGSGTQLYYEAQVVEVNKGIYNVLVGDGSNSFTGNDPDSYAPAGGQTGGIPASVFNRDNLWLEIEIDEDNPLDPRTRVVSSAYAFNADTLDGKDSAAFLEAGSDATLADVQVNTLSFVGGGGLDASKMTKVDEVTGGGTTTLHNHGSAASMGTIAQVVAFQTRTMGSYTGGAGDGVVITPMTITITPKKAGNMIILDWVIHGEAANYDSVFLASRNGTRLPDTTNASNSAGAGIASGQYDTDDSTTPYVKNIRIIDFDSLATQTTYELRFRGSDGGNRTWHLNRSVSGGGPGTGNEQGLSTGTAWEIWK